MVADHHYKLFVSARYYIEIIPHALHAAIRFPFESVARLHGYFQDHENLRQENEALSRRNTEMSLRIRELSGVEKQNRRLRDLMNASSNFDAPDYRVAEVLRVLSTSSKHRLIIKKGARDGIAVGQPILNGQGVLGHVVSITPFTATGILITDPNYALQVRLQRTGLTALVVGKGVPNEVSLRYAPSGADIRVGDLIVSSGLDGRYPSDHPIGRVTRVERQSPHGTFAEVTLEPTAATNYGREVILLDAPDQKTTRS